MNPPVAPPLITPPAKHRWLWLVLVLLLIPAVILCVLAASVVSCFRPSSETRALRTELTRASGADWRQQISLNVGSVPLALARAGLAFVSVEPEATAALRSVRGAELGIYELSAGVERPDRTAMLSAADRVMNSHGWERVVGVLDGGNLVGVYLQANLNSARRVQACVVVLDERQLVVVSARANLEPLLDCLRKQTDWRSEIRSLASR